MVPPASYPAVFLDVSTVAASLTDCARSHAHTVRTSIGALPAYRARNHRSASAAPPLPARRAKQRDPLPAIGPVLSDLVSHSRPAPDRPPHAAPWQTSASPARDALPRSRSRPARLRRASWSAPPARIGYYAATGKTSTPDTKSATRATLPPSAPSRAALRPSPSD